MAEIVQSSNREVVKSFETFRRFAATLGAIAPRSVGESIAVTIGLGLTEGVGLLLLVPLLGLVGIDTGHQAVSGILARVNRAFAALGITPTLPAVLATYVVIVAAQSTFQRREMILSARLQHEVVEGLRRRLYRAIAAARWTFLARTRASDYTHVLTEEVHRVGTAAYLVVDVAATSAIVAAYLAMAARVSLPMTAIVVASGLLLGLVVRPLVTSSMRIGRARSHASSQLEATITEHLASIKIAKGYGIEKRHADMFDALARDVGEVNLAAAGGYGQVKQLLAIASAALLAVIVYVAYGFLGISAGSLLLLLFLFGRMVPRANNLYERAQSIAVEVAALDRVLDLEARCRAAAEPVVASPLPVSFTRHLQFDRVTFDYTGERARPALDDVSLAVPAGATTAIVGPSGSGKTTVADIVLGLLEPASGRVLVDDVPLGPERLQSWRDQIGYVAQDAFLFHDTIAANLRWARSDATDADLWEALRLAAADAFVRALPQQLETVLGDRGILVSGGERQRLSLARALLRKPTLLVLDEPTSALDSENERRIQDAIDSLHEQVTILIITHRLSTIRNADMIHVLERGRVVESGSWADLTRRQGSRFRELCAAQGVDLDDHTRGSVQERALGARG